jgi:hypothetical protein
LIIPKGDVPLAAIEGKLKESKPFSKYRLLSPQYYYVEDKYDMKHAQRGLERLFYSTFIVTNGSSLVQFVGMDVQVQPPQFDIDLNRLVEQIDLSYYKNGAVFFYTVFVDEHGVILGVDSDPWGTEYENSIILSKAHVITPGMPNGVPVPTAVCIAVPSR